MGLESLLSLAGPVFEKTKDCVHGFSSYIKADVLPRLLSSLFRAIDLFLIFFMLFLHYLYYPCVFSNLFGINFLIIFVPI